jgi:hypothetical protein
MYRFASLYSLFRPHTVTHGHPYRGTVGSMDEIYDMLSSVFGQELDSNFSHWGHSRTILGGILRRQPARKDKVDWEHVEWDLEFIKKAVDETIVIHSFENAAFYKFSGFESFFHDLVIKFLSENSDGVVLEEGADKSIIINSRSVSLKTNIGTLVFENKHQLFHLLRRASSL